MSTSRGIRTRTFWYSVGLFVVFNSLFLALVLLKPGTPRQFIIADDVGQALGWLLAMLLCFVGLERPWQRTPSRSDSVLTTTAQRWIPVLIALGIFCQFIGQVLYTYYDFNKLKDFPSLADVGYLSTFPFLLAGILLLPTRPLPGITRTRVVQDGFMIMTAVVTFSWYFVLGPTMLQGNETVFAKIVGSAYPFFDLVLIFCVLRLSFSLSDPALRPVIRLLSLGLVIIVITDSIYDYQTLRDIYANGLQDIGWPIGYMLLGLAAQALNLARAQQNVSMRAAIDKETSHDRTIAVSSGWRSLLPYALIPAVILLTVYTWRASWRADAIGPLLERGVYLGGIVLIGMVSLRQFFVIRETIFYNRELQRMQQELRVKNQALSEANMQLETQGAQIEEAYKEQLHLNELKDQFLLNVNHELRTPLTAIHGYLELLQEYHGQLDTARETTFINLAVQGCEELQQLVTHVLDTIQGDFQGKEPQFEVFSVVTVVREAIDLFEPQKQQDYQIAVEIPEDLTVRADRQYVHQVLLNLLSNAFKYSPKHTSVVISAQLNDFCTLDGHVHRQVCICVQDAGLGIPPSEIPLLFGKFVRLKRDIVGSARGTGLGLYICKQLVEAMEGHIWVESQGIAGKGSRFYFTLPSVPQAIIEEQPQAQVPLTEVASLATTSMTQDEMLFPFVVKGSTSPELMYYVILFYEVFSCPGETSLFMGSACMQIISPGNLEDRLKNREESRMQPDHYPNDPEYMHPSESNPPSTPYQRGEHYAQPPYQQGGQYMPPSYQYPDQPPQGGQQAPMRQDKNAKYVIAKAIDYIRWALLALELFFILRFVLKLIGADPFNPFAQFLYGLTGFFLYPFEGIVPNTKLGTHGFAVFEWSTLIGMAVYGIIIWILVLFLRTTVSKPEEPIY